MSVDWAQVFDYSVVGIFGLFVGTGELVSRYRDAPERVLRTVPAWIYVSVNLAAALAALFVVRVFHWRFGSDPALPDQVRLVQVAVAGFTAMALFRSALFTVRIGDSDVAVGPASFLKVVLDAADRGVDRLRATERVPEVMRAIKGVSFRKVYLSLPTLCFELMQNVPDEVQREVGEELKKLYEAPLEDNVKVMVLGLKLMNVVGVGVLLKAVESLGMQIREAQKVELPPSQQIPLGQTIRLPARVLDDQGREIPPAGLAWLSADPAIATVDSSGNVCALAPGKVFIAAGMDRVSAQTMVECVASGAAAPPQTIPIPPATVAGLVGVNSGDPPAAPDPGVNPVPAAADPAASGASDPPPAGDPDPPIGGG